MGDTKPTPGPWFHDDANLWACVTTAPRGGGRIVLTADTRGWRTARDDARLAAAAPDLLAACEAAIHDVCAMIEATAGVRGHNSLRLLDAAITKAKGATTATGGEP